MSHSGKWEGRTRMAWATWYVGGAMIAVDVIGYFLGRAPGGFSVSGTAMITMVVMAMIAGKVAHDKGSTNETK